MLSVICLADIEMGSILLDGVLISIGQTFECPVCQVFKKTSDFLSRVKGGKFKSSDIICNHCFDKRVKDEKNAMNNQNIAKIPKMWKWIHTSSCPEVEEYGGGRNLQRYCLKCLKYVLSDSSTDWHKYLHVKQVLKSENSKIRSLQDYCIKQIIEKNVQFAQLPITLKNKIQFIQFQHKKKKLK